MISRHEKNQIRRNSRKARLQSKSSSESLSTVSCINKRDKRFKSYFEPIFNPTDEWPFSEAPWRILGDKRNYHSVLTARNLLVQLANFDREVIQSASFESCDFDGDFSQSSPSFKKCVFDKCDFGLSSWRRARFKGCTFIRTSFSLSTFVDCEFRDCKFIEIGFSGNETILDGTLFTNPTEFISNVYLNEDPEILRKNGTSLSYQSMRLDGTKVSISRTLLANLAVSGEEKSYYAILKFNQRQSLIAKMSNNRYELASKPGLDKEIQLVGRLVLLKSEFLMMNFIGRINNWGESVAKPTLIGIAVILVFALLYYLTGMRQNAWAALEASVDISLLIGYTKHAAISCTNSERFAFTCNMVAGLIWYSVFVPTIIGRVSRIR